MSTINFHLIANLCTHIGTSIDPAAIQGYCCGLLCANRELTVNHWLTEAHELLDSEESTQADHEELLKEIYKDALHQLYSSDLDLNLLLPDDDEDIQARATSLSYWCDSFLSGFGLAHKKPPQQAEEALTDDVSDILADFSAIAQLDAEGEETEDSENSYMELVEYVRMAAISLFMEHNQVIDPVSQYPLSTPASKLLH